MKKVLGHFIVVSSVVLVLTVPISWTYLKWSNPDMTEIRVILTYWKFFGGLFMAGVFDFILIYIYMEFLEKKE